MENVTLNMQPALVNVPTFSQGGEAAFLEGQEKMFQQLLDQLFQPEEGTKEQIVETAIEVELPATEPAEKESFDESVFQALQHFLRFPPNKLEEPKLEIVQDSVESAALPSAMVANRVELAVPVEQTATEQAEMEPAEQQSKQPETLFVAQPAEQPTIDVVALEEPNRSFEPELVSKKDQPAQPEPTVIEGKKANQRPEPIPFEAVPQLQLNVPEKTMPLPSVEKVAVTWQQPEQVVREIGQTVEVYLQKMQPNEVKVVQVKLTPETLGELEIRLEWQGERVEAKIYVQQEDVKRVLEEQMPRLLEQLPAEPIVQQISIAVMPQPFFQPFTGQWGTRKHTQQPTDKYHSSGKRTEEETDEREEQSHQISGISLYI